MTMIIIIIIIIIGLYSYRKKYIVMVKADMNCNIFLKSINIRPATPD